jgi:thioester reductase-like protein
MPARASVVLFGSTGYVGKLILADLLRSTPWRVILPVRPQHDGSDVLEGIGDVCRRSDSTIDPSYRERVFRFTLPPREDSIRLPAGLRTHSVEKVINAAGNVHYFAEAELNEGNLDMTGRTLEFARWLGSPDYVYISSVFSAGYREGKIGEDLHDEPDADPTYYTKTKRLAERMVATSGLPYIIVRPSVLIGHSRTGVYTGKPYGLYQFLKSFTYFLMDRYYPEIHVVAPEHPFHLLHQDTFALLFVHLLGQLTPNRIVNMVSDETELPTTRDLYAHFFTNVTYPEKVFLYDRIDDVPLDKIPRRQRMFSYITRVNAQISGHSWTFERSTVARLESECAAARPTTVASTQKCIDTYIENSVRCQRYRNRYRWQFPPRSIFVPVPHD